MHFTRFCEDLMFLYWFVSSPTKRQFLTGMTSSGLSRSTNKIQETFGQRPSTETYVSCHLVGAVHLNPETCYTTFRRASNSSEGKERKRNVPIKTARPCDNGSEPKILWSATSIVIYLHVFVRQALCLKKRCSENTGREGSHHNRWSVLPFWNDRTSSVTQMANEWREMPLGAVPRLRRRIRAKLHRIEKILPGTMTHNVNRRSFCLLRS